MNSWSSFLYLLSAVLTGVWHHTYFCIYSVFLKNVYRKDIFRGKRVRRESFIYSILSFIHSVSICWAFSKGQHQAGSRTEYNDQKAEFSFIASLLYSSTVQGYHWVKLGKRSAEVRTLITSWRHDSRVKGFRLKSDSLLMVRNINLQQTLAYTLANAVYPLDSFLKCQPNTVERKSARVTTLWFWDGASVRSTGSEFLYSAA